MKTVQPAEFKMSQEGVDKLAAAAKHLREGADHLEHAHDLFLELRESGDLSIVVDLFEVEPGDELSTSAVIDSANG